MHDDIVSPEQGARGVALRDVPTPMIGGRPGRPIVIVLGMQRSGTSLCAHVLSALGLDMSDDIDVTPSNAKCHWERRAIVELHDRVLAVLNRGYFTPFHDLPFPIAWWADPEVAKIRREIVAVLEKTPDSAWFGVKDPRLVRLLPLWQQIFRETKFAPKFVLCLRNPAEVARSLAVRDGLDPELGEYRWFSYMADAFRYTKGHDICVVEYESWFDDAARNIATLQHFLDLPRLQNDYELALTISAIVNDRLRHKAWPGREARQPLVRVLYELARRAAQDSAAREEIERITAEFSRVQLLQRGLHRAFERIATLAGERDQANEERARIATELAATTAECERVSDENERITDELNRTREEYNRITAEQNAAGVYRKLLLQSLDEITGERDALLRALYEIAHERDAARAETAERDRVANALMEGLFRVVREQVAEELGIYQRRRSLIPRLPSAIFKRAQARRAATLPT